MLTRNAAQIYRTAILALIAIRGVEESPKHSSVILTRLIGRELGDLGAHIGPQRHTDWIGHCLFSHFLVAGSRSQ
mgnify:CR=1 FL=1